MSLVEYSINGKYFRDFGVYVSSSSGLGEPKPKDRTVFDWKEYNGVFSDLEQKPKYQPREIEIKGFAKGENFEAVLRNIKTLFSEFKKAGKQRLLIEAQGQSALVYDVVLVGEVDPDRVYNDDEIFATYTAKLVEYSPIKKILKLDSKNLILNFNTPKWVEVNIDGRIYPEKGAVNINKILDNRVLTSLNFSGRNLLLKSDFTKIENGYGIFAVNAGNINPSANGLSFVTSAYGDGVYGGISGLKVGKEYVLSIWTKATYQENTLIQIGFNNGTSRLVELPTSGSQYIKTSVLITTNAENDYIILYNGRAGANNFLLKYIKLEEGNKATVWNPAPEDQHFITIAGNVDEITNLTTNAVELWKD